MTPSYVQQRLALALFVADERLVHSEHESGKHKTVVLISQVLTDLPVW
jgi:hypothetical protein